MEIKKKFSERKDYIDYCKAIGILMVIYGHLSARKNGYSYAIFHYIYAIHMPLFFLTSGLTFSNKSSFKMYLFKKVKSLLLPYLQIYILYYFFKILLGGEILSISHFYNIFKGDIYSVYPITLWFLPCMFVTMLGYRIIEMIRNVQLQHIIIFICLLFSLFNSSKGPMYWSINIIGVTMFFVHIGYTIKKSRHTLSFLHHGYAVVLLNLISVIGCYFNTKIVENIFPYSVSIGDAVYGSPLLFLITAIAGCLFIVALSTKIKSKFLLYIGKNSFIIYALHIFVKDFCMQILALSPLNTIYTYLNTHKLLVILSNLILTSIITIGSIALGKYVKKIGLI